jgi:hypothetical protein
MEYVLLIYGDETAAHTGSPEMLARFGEFTEEVVRRGVMRGGNRLRTTSAATTVRVRDGKTVTTDGPFAETKEQLGGFYLLDCKDLDEALELAAKIPAAESGSVEVRPVWPMGE